MHRPTRAFILWSSVLLTLGCTPVAHPHVAFAQSSGLSGAVRVVGAGLQNPARPRFDPSGEHLVVHAGGKGARDIYIIDVATGVATQLTKDAADERDPTFDRTGEHVVFASNVDGDYDLYQIPIGHDPSAPTRLTHLPGDELEPSVNPLSFTFVAVFSDGCSSEGAGGKVLQSYDKIAFTRRGDDAASAIWFVSDDGAHSGQISPQGRSCASPAWSGDGLSLAFSCDEAPQTVVLDTQAAWEQSYSAAIAALVPGDGAPSSEPPTCQLWEIADDWTADTCLPNLPRQYATYPGVDASKAERTLEAPVYSTNQTMMVAYAPGDTGSLAYRTRAHLAPDTRDAEWTALSEVLAAPRNPAWSPDGAVIAFDGERDGARVIGLAPVDFYLQDVHNLIEFPELVGPHASPRLHANGLVARVGEEKEFFEAYERLRYRHRPQYVTADAALQVFRDEFVRLLERGEQRAQEDLATLTATLAPHYAATTGPDARYYAVYFWVPWVFLDAAQNTPEPTAEDWMMHSQGGYLDDDERAEMAALFMPYEERFAAAIGPALERVPESLREEVTLHVHAALAHEGLGELAVPGQAHPSKLDWSQFKIRGNYADNGLGGYFLAMNWFAQVPLPIDRELVALLDLLEREVAPDGSTLIAVWQRVDTMVGAFMGRPVDATLAHLIAIRQADAQVLTSFDTAAVEERLLAMRGEIPVRGVEGAVSGKNHPLRFSFFPKRLGLDAAWFSAVTHPKVATRGLPSALDIFAAFGVERARAHAEAEASTEAYLDDYRLALDRLAAETAAREPGYWSTDIYHSWLAALGSLATPKPAAPEARLAFTASEAWADRLLMVALAGFTQLKHTAVLYSMQEMGIECGDEPPIYLLIEQPVLPVPRGFVEPVPEFFTQMAAVSAHVYGLLGEEPQVSAFWGPDEGEAVLNGRVFLEKLAAAAQAEVEGRPLSEEQNAWILTIGGEMEALFLQKIKDPYAYQAGGAARLERGVALVTDVYTNVQRGQVLQLGIGRLLDLYVAVPSPVGRRIAQGAAFSFYTFLHAMGDRLTDASWHEALVQGKTPPLPPWSSSFIEP